MTDSCRATRVTAWLELVLVVCPTLILLLAGCGAADVGRGAESYSLMLGYENRTGTEVCFGCRLQREVRRAATPVVLSERPSVCSEWVRQNVADHEHVWKATGCWFGDDGSVACGSSPALIAVSSSDWLEYLLSLPEPSRLDVIRAAASDSKSAEQYAQECKSWLAGRTPGDDA